MLRIGLSYWGFCESHSAVANTPDGHRYGRPILVDALTNRGHRVVALQQRREEVPYKHLIYDTGFPELDIVFLEWRWPTYKNSGPRKFEPDLDRQEAILDHYLKLGVPVIAWDTDLKMTPEDEARWPRMIVADPTLEPENFLIVRDRLPFWSDFKPIMPPADEPVEFGYIGNNYERDEMFTEYYSNAAASLRPKGVQTKVHGNWLQRSPERESPEVLIAKHPYVSFGNRVGFHESMALLNSFICTVHITKPRYAKQGFASPRYLENIITNTPALVPSEFLVPDLLGSHWTVSSSHDVVRKVLELKGLGRTERESVVLEQKANLLRYYDFSVDAVCQFIESSVK